MMTATLLFNKPDNPKAFMAEFLTNVKLTGTKPLINREDLDAMFGMFDVVKRGVITCDQANNALRSILGPSVTLQSMGVAEGANLTKEQFVDNMEAALRENVPYRQ